MNYRHTYHAGNFADVFKHTVLVTLLQSLIRKENAFCYLDTHAGIGTYDLLSDATQKKKEFHQGIMNILEAANPPSVIQTYLKCVQTANVSLTDAVRYYPGSPCIARYFLRPQDRMVLCELQEEDSLQLKKMFFHDKQTAVHHQDGYQALKAFLPPKERRGLVLIDPPYEDPDEWSRLLTALPNALNKWETGIYALWYPIKIRRSIERFLRTLKLNIARPILATELSIYPEDNATQLNGNGMLIINQPWQLDQTIKEMLPWLWRTLSPLKQGRHDIRFL